MNKEQFIALGLTDEQADKAAAASQDELKGFVPKARFDEVNEAKKKFEGDLSDRDKQLVDLKKAAEGNEELKNQIETLQADNKTATDKYTTDMKDLRVSTALKLALGNDVHDTDLVLSLLDKTKIEIDEAGSIKAGFDDQVKALRESKAFLFAEKQEDKGFQFKGAKPVEGKGDNGGGSGQTGDFGKRLADFAKSNEGLDKARASYFE
ncbi:hypothetical protein BVG16_15725 [Paenibacillus selenitireducens]|uniref:Phage minor structural protein GP20 n=1 Tax=Paenibacillus selenitireducens TaxID=1324314 RepID=A0A1T2X9V5_9BACL|nr:phage scaffolding protein [Paenibacillus selenitireducens]OPA76630.1 hypothetical protein BVG16_15725 [Paenibacillus selenitireducens]